MNQKEESRIELLDRLVKTGRKLSPEEARSYLYKCEEEGRHVPFVVKVDAPFLREWYEERSPFDSRLGSYEDETLYLSNSNNKCFQHGKIGYSCFATCRAALLNPETRGFEGDRIEHWPKVCFWVE